MPTAFLVRQLLDAASVWAIQHLAEPVSSQGGCQGGRQPVHASHQALAHSRTSYYLKTARTLRSSAIRLLSQYAQSQPSCLFNATRAAGGHIPSHRSSPCLLNSHTTAHSPTKKHILPPTAWQLAGFGAEDRPANTQRPLPPQHSKHIMGPA